MKKRIFKRTVAKGFFHGTVSFVLALYHLEGTISFVFVCALLTRLASFRYTFCNPVL
jgi:hypothetical protein